MTSTSTTPLPEGVRQEKLRVRIKGRIKIDGGGCWLWLLRRTNVGYGVINVDQRTALAHRISYEAFTGPIPEGLDLDHLCRVRHCVNPAHLEPVTRRENLLRSPIAPAAINAAKTHCPQGHEYTPENTIQQKVRRGRLCRICQAAPRAGSKRGKSA